MGFALLEAVRWTIVPAAVIGAMALFRKMFPAQKSGHVFSESELQQLDDRFSPLRGRVLSAMIAIAIVFLFGTWAILVGLNNFLANLDGAATFRFFPQSAIWWFLPGFGALALSWEFTLQLWAVFGDRSAVNLFSDWTNQSTSFWGASSFTGMDSRKVLRWLALIIVLPVGFFTVLALNMNAGVGPQVIRDCGYAFKPCTVYPLSNVRRITLVEGFRNTDGSFTRQAGIVLDFKNERRWSTTDWGESQDHVDPALLEFLKKKTGLPLNVAVTEKDIPPLPQPGKPN